MEIGAGTGDLNGASFVFYGELGRDNYTSEPYQYLRGRGITFASMRSYLLGHASKELVPAHFANRIVFPVWDQSENVLGFKGRTYRAGDKHRPKMVVYPTGSKVGAVPYGLRQAAEYMEEMGFCVIAEGELDVITDAGRHPCCWGYDLQLVEQAGKHCQTVHWELLGVGRLRQGWLCRGNKDRQAPAEHCC